MELKDIHFGGIYLDCGNDLFMVEEILDDGSLLGYTPEEWCFDCPTRIYVSSLIEERTKDDWDAALKYIENFI